MYQCPACRSNRVKVQYPDISCMACGYNDSLMDFPISHEHHRALCFDNNRPVPISCTTIIKEKEKESNIKKEKEKVTLNKEQWGAIKQVHAQVFNLQAELKNHLTKSKKKVYTIE